MSSVRYNSHAFHVESRGNDVIMGSEFPTSGMSLYGANPSDHYNPFSSTHTLASSHEFVVRPLPVYMANTYPDPRFT